MYIGPDVLMPIGSVIAAVVGFVLMFWRRLVGMFHAVTAKLTGKSRSRGGLRCR